MTHPKMSILEQIRHDNSETIFLRKRKLKMRLSDRETVPSRSADTLRVGSATGKDQGSPHGGWGMLYSLAKETRKVLTVSFSARLQLTQTPLADGRLIPTHEKRGA